MKNIDEIIQKLLQLKPNKIHEKDSIFYYILYNDITLCFCNMDYQNCAMVKINNGENFYIGENNRLLILEFFNKSYNTNEILTKLNQDIRKEKLLSIDKNT